jgi:hypothetical protein
MHLDLTVNLANLVAFSTLISTVVVVIYQISPCFITSRLRSKVAAEKWQTFGRDSLINHGKSSTICKV